MGAARSIGAARPTPAHHPLLAPDFVVVAESPDPQRRYLGSPGLAKLPGGRLVATYDHFGRQVSRAEQRCHVALSNDEGGTWRTVADLEGFWCSPFVGGPGGGTLYLIGCRHEYGDVLVYRSEDGERWSAATTVLAGSYHTAPTGIARANGRLYKAVEEQATGRWASGFRAVMLSAPLDADLTDAGVWRSTPPLPYAGDPDKLGFGLYGPHADPPRPADAHGWLEGNAVLVRGRIKDFLRVETGGIPNIAAALTLVEDAGAAPHLEFDSFVPWPGGQCKFFVLHDGAGRAGTTNGGYYWMVSNAPTDHLQDPAPLAAGGFSGPPANERRILNLYYSLDAYNWFTAGTVAMGHRLLEAFSYAALVIDGDDLLVLSRTSLGGKNQHDTNLITFHRVRGFRSLALDLRPDAT